MRSLRLVVVPVVGALAVALSSACGWYESTDRPICGDKLLPDGFQCGLWPAPCGCVEDQRCGTDGKTLVCMTPGTQGVDAPCTADRECAKGTWCDGTRCRQTCFESLDCGDDEAVTCLLVTDDKENKLAGFCQRDCDPVSPQAPSDARLETCRSDETCLVDPTNGAAACTRAAGSTAIGAACTKGDECVAGAQCIVGKGCEKLCWVDGSPACPGTAKCVGLSIDGVEITVLGRKLGVCQ